MPGIESAQESDSGRQPKAVQPFLRERDVQQGFMRRVRGKGMLKPTDLGQVEYLNDRDELGEGELVSEVDVRPGMLELFEELSVDGAETFSLDTID